MKPFLVDVPVKINIWIRPECQKKQFEVIREARPSILFIQSDGGRNDKEWEAIKKNRKMIDEGIDWDCTVYRLYEDSNNGLYAMGKKTRELIWSHVDRCIFLEDDILPSVSFFRYCSELLEYYKDDLRINSICGMNHEEVSNNVTSDYFFSRQGSIWGTASWKRSHDKYGDFSYGTDPYIMSLLKERTKRNPTFWKKIVAYSKSEKYEGHIAAGEFFKEFAMYGYNQVQIIPKYNMISNIGCTDDAAHSLSLNRLPYGLRRVFNMRTYEIEFPLKHPGFIIPDVEYEKRRNRIMAYNMPILQKIRLIEGTWARIHADGISEWFKRQIKRVFCKENIDEK